MWSKAAMNSQKVKKLFLFADKNILESYDNKFPKPIYFSSLLYKYLVMIILDIFDIDEIEFKLWKKI